MIDIFKNSQIISRVAEDEVRSILAHFNSGYVLSLVQSQLADRYNPINPYKPNIIKSFEDNFNDLKNEYPFDVGNIEKIRLEVFDDIIKMISSSCDIRFGIDQDNEYELYQALFYLYDLMISSFCRNNIEFISNYIYTLRNDLYEVLQLKNNKKEKDAASIYIKKKYDDPVISSIVAKISQVVYFISSMDVTFQQYVEFCYKSHGQKVVDLILNTITPNDPFIFQHQFCVVNNPAILSSIRVCLIQKHVQDTQVEDAMTAKIQDKQLTPLGVNDILNNL